MKKSRLILAPLVAALSLIVVPSAFANGPIAGRAGRAEVRFMEGMSDHHQMALDMANDCLKKAKADSVVKTCQDIIQAQTPEIKQMHDWLLAWYNVDYKTMPMSQMSQATPEMGGMHGATPAATEAGTNMGGANSDPAGMMGMMAGFNRLEGQEFELAFLESMIDHHDDAIHMSQRVLKIAEHPELRTFAQKVIDDQTAEIQKMEGLITQLNKK
jgi:uncharacterized protein (DUF305 family)